MVKIHSFITFLVFFICFSTLGILFLALQTEYTLLILLLLDFVYLPFWCYVIYRLIKIADEKSYQEFLKEHTLQ